jgi:MFS family permease
MTYLGLTAGPSIGGWLAMGMGWQAVFYINLPISLLAILAGWRFIQNDHGNQSGERFDLAGALLFMTGLVLLLLALNQGHAWGWLSVPILGLALGAALVLGLFLETQRRSPAPMLDLALFRIPTFSLSVASAILNYICVYSVIFLMPFFLIEGRGFTPAQTGLVLTAQPVIMALIAPLSGTLSDRIGVRLPSAGGMAVLSAGVLMLSRLDGAAPLWQVIGALAVVGLGTGTFISPNNSALMGSAPRHRQGIAAGVLATARNLGMVLGVGLTGAIFTSLLGHASAASSPNLFPAIQTSFLVSGLLGIVGAVTSFIRQAS